MKEHVFTGLPVKNGEVWWARIVEESARLLCKVKLQEWRSFRRSIVRLCAQRLEKNGEAEEVEGLGGQKEARGDQERGSVMALRSCEEEWLKNFSKALLRSFLL